MLGLEDEPFLLKWSNYRSRIPSFSWGGRDRSSLVAFDFYTNMENKNGGLEDEFPFPNRRFFRFQPLILQGAIIGALKK